MSINVKFGELEISNLTMPQLNEIIPQFKDMMGSSPSVDKSKLKPKPVIPEPEPELELEPKSDPIIVKPAGRKRGRKPKLKKNEPILPGMGCQICGEETKGRRLCAVHHQEYERSIVRMDLRGWAKANNITNLSNLDTRSRTCSISLSEELIQINGRFYDLRMIGDPSFIERLHEVTKGWKKHMFYTTKEIRPYIPKIMKRFAVKIGKLPSIDIHREGIVVKNMMVDENTGKVKGGKVIPFISDSVIDKTHILHKGVKRQVDNAFRLTPEALVSDQFEKMSYIPKRFKTKPILTRDITGKVLPKESTGARKIIVEGLYGIYKEYAVWKVENRYACLYIEDPKL